MDWLTQIVSQPATQLLGPFGIALALHKFGVIDLRAILRRALMGALEAPTADVRADNRDALQPLYLKMDELASHYNHDTTDLLKMLVEGQKQTQIDQKELRGTQLQQCTKLDIMVDSLQDIIRNGIRIRT